MQETGAVQGLRPVRVCLDGRILGLRGGTGVATYAANLAQGVGDAGYAMETLTDAPAAETRGHARSGQDHRLRRWGMAALPWSRAAEPTTEAPRARVVSDVFRVAQVHFDLYGNYLRLRSLEPPPLMHWSYPLPLRFLGAVNLYTVHDLIPLLQPDLSPVSQRRARRLLERLGREATHLVTVSEASRREIIGVLGWPAERVTNTYQAVKLPNWTADGAQRAIHDAARAAGVEPGGYVLHVGTVERRKNIGRLIEAWRESGVDCPLVLAGPDGWHAGEEMRPAVQFLGRAGGARVVRIPWMDRAALLGLMGGARALLAPSLSEGFGLPAIEAMAMGVPVMTSSVDIDGVPGAAAEIAETAALLVDPRDIRAMARAIAALGTDPDLRGRLIGLGLKRARHFSQEAYAGRLRALYASVLARP